MPEPVAIAASPNADWLAVRHGDRLSLVAADTLEVTAAIQLDTGDADLAFAGAPAQLLVLVRAADGPPELRLYNPPSLDAVSAVEIPAPAHLAAITGPRAGLISGSPANLVIARCAPRALLAQPADLGGQLDLLIGLERNQLLAVTPKRLEIWDAVSRRAMLRLNLTLPPPPRIGGAAEGHVWIGQPGGKSVIVYRMSDGRTYELPLGGALRAGASDPNTPHVVFATSTGLVRLNALTRTAQTIGLPPTAAIAVAAPKGHAVLFGVNDDGVAWRLPLTTVAPEPAPAPKPGMSWPRPRAAAPEVPVAPTAAAPVPIAPAAAAPVPVAPPAAAPVAPILAPPAPPLLAPVAASTDPEAAWREQLVDWTRAALRSDPSALATDPPRATGTPLTDLDADLGPHARRVLALAYGAWLTGAPALAIATVARAAGGDDAWREALATGELGLRRWLEVDAGRVQLTRPTARFLDGAAPEHVVIAGGDITQATILGAHVLALPDDASAAPALDALVARLGRVAFTVPGANLTAAAIEASLARAVLIVLPRTARAAALAVWARGRDALILWPGAVPAGLASLPYWA
jgi:hypothetical protein